METRKIEAFVTVAECESYSRASKLLFESYSTVRHWILTLEKELKVSLFLVQDKQVSLTKAGKDFMPYAKNILESLDKNLSKFNKSEHTMEGEFTISTNHDIGNLWITEALEDFLLDYPQTNVEIRASEDTQPFTNSASDVYITSNKFSRNDIFQEVLLEYDMNLYASESYLKKEGVPNTIEDLQNHRIIGFCTKNPYPYDNINWHLKYLPEEFQFYVVVNSNIAIRQFVEKGIGIGAVSQFEAKKSKVKLVKILPNECKGIKIPVYLRYPVAKGNSQKVINLKKHLSKSIEKILK